MWCWKSEPFTGGAKAKNKAAQSLDQYMKTSCNIHAHLLLLLRNAPLDAKDSVSVFFLCAFSGGSPSSWKVRGSSCRLWSCFVVGMILCLAWVWSFQLRSLKTFYQIPVRFCHNLIQWYIVAKPWNTSHLGHSLQSVVAALDIIWYHIIFYIISYYFLLSNRPTSRRNWAMRNL